MVLLSFVCWDCEFESRRGHGRLSVVSVVCCQIEVSASSRSLVQRSPTDCDVSGCDSVVLITRPIGAVAPWAEAGMNPLTEKL